MNWLRKIRAKYTNLHFTGMLLYTGKTYWIYLGTEEGYYKDIAFSSPLRIMNYK